MTAPVPAPAPGGQDPTPPAPVPAPPAVPPTPADPTPPAGPVRDVAWYEAELAKVRNEAARDRTAGKAAAVAEAQQELIKRITGGDAPVDPATLATQIQETNAARAALAAENFVLRLAPRLGADPDALVDSSTFMRDVAKLDPTSATYATDLEKLITDKITAQPRYKATTAAPPTLAPPPASDPANGAPGQPAPGSPSGVDAMRTLLAQARGGKKP